MAKVERVSPMNISNTSLESMAVSPGYLNTSEAFKFLTPGVMKFRRSFTPSSLNCSKSPNLSPIKAKTPIPVSPFLKKRDLKNRIIVKQKLRTLNNIENINEVTLSVKGILMDLGLTEYLCLFEEQEIFLDVFFTITDADLKAIGIAKSEHRQKLLDFIGAFSTPKKKSAACQTNTIKTVLFRRN